MKKLVTVMIALATTMAMLACGAAPHPARQGITKPVEDSIDAHTAMNGQAPDYVYFTNEYEARSVSFGGINLDGFFSPNGYSAIIQKNAKVQVIITVKKLDESSCDARLVVSLNRQVSPIPSISCTHNSSSMHMTFNDGSNISLTGHSVGGTGANITIRDYNMQKAFVDNVWFQSFNVIK